ncbi:MAG TPA: sulfotransferase, partial [Polyangiaceae bacterium]|nr:sulfotransferase [Polyangiaceae bacterium]
PDEAEECLFLFDSTMVSSSFWVAAPAYRYLDWYTEQDQRGPYRQYREHLQIFQAEQPTRRLTLKAPIHTANLGALIEAVPNVRLVQLHRDPAQALNSVNSLFYTLHHAVSDELDLHKLGRANLEFMAHGIERNLAARDALAPGTLIDVYYDELVADPVGVVRRIREHHGLDFDADYAARIEAFVRANPQHKHGRHRYSSADFGLDDESIRARFASYLEQFPRLRPAGK